MNMKYTTWIEIDGSNLEHNVSQYKSWVSPSTGIAPVIKGNAYGHGLHQIGSLHDQNHNVSRLCVVNSTEALQLRQHKIKKPILILSYATPSDLEDIIMQEIDLAVTDLQTIQLLHKKALKLGKKASIHLKVDTGMSRFGVLPRDVAAMLNEIKSMPMLHLQGMFSHLSCSNKRKFVHEQEDIFQPLRDQNIQFHMTNTLGTINCKNDYDFARVGLGIYGYILTKNNLYRKALKPVLSLKTRIVQIKTVEKNAYLGYQRIHHIKKQTKTAIIGLGYFDGLPPDFANHGHVLIHGQYAPIMTINMNVATVDITHIPQCAIQDEVVVLGQQDDKSISAYDWQKLLNQNMRMFFTAFDANLPRIIVHDNKEKLLL